MDKKVKQLKQALQNIEPTHDTPVGRIHPYWARKPLNVVNEIIKSLTSPGDVVLDPFMGSGTMVFSALMLKRHALGNDLNPLSRFIVQSILELNLDSDDKKNDVKNFNTELFQKIKPWFELQNQDAHIERERFEVNGTFAEGQFKLKSYELVVRKKQENGSFKRVVLTNSHQHKASNDYKKYLTQPVNFKNCNLIPNSRIAVQKGENLSHFYTEQNTASINYALHLIDNNGFKSHSVNTLKFLLSSSLPLLRLSDTKASSQWPYWRPKNKLTSRSPVMVLKKRTKSYLELIEWVSKNISDVKIVTKKQFDPKDKSPNVSIFNKSAAEILTDKFPKVDLLLSDPPYSDQVPYLEYSLLWLKLLGLKTDKYIWDKEIVKTDAPSRKNDTFEYSYRLEEAFRGCCKVIKKNGYLVWFYQDRDLKNWSLLGRAAKQTGFTLMDILPIKKQRRSMKTVTSSGSTFDGDLIMVFKNTGIKKDVNNKGFKIEVIRNKAKEIIKSKHTLFENYANLIKCGLVEGWLDEVGDRNIDVVQLIKSLDLSVK